MDDVLEVLLRACAFTVVPLVAGAVTVFLRELRRRRVEAPDPDGCIACGETDVGWVGDGVYVCPSCGYEGGPGHAAWLASEQRRRMAELPEEQRRARARQALVESHSLAVSASAALRTVRETLPNWPTTSGTPREARPWESDLLRALGDVATAFARLSEAAACLDESAPAPPDVKPELWQTQLGEIDVVCVKEDLSRAIAALTELQRVHDRWLAELG